MDDMQVGRVLRAVRLRSGLRQLDVARRAGLSQQLVSSVERGNLEHASVHALRSIGRALDVRIVIAPRWRGTDLERLLDSAHASIVERVARYLRSHRWQVIIEFTFSHYGERGSVDIIGWQPAAQALLLVEAKSELVNLQDLHASMDRKRRLVPRLVQRDRGWRPAAIGEILVVEDRRASRSIVSRHAATFDVRLPARSVAARAWIRSPIGALAACWFLAPTAPGSGIRGLGARRRVRVAKSRSAIAQQASGGTRDPA